MGSGDEGEEGDELNLGVLGFLVGVCVQRWPQGIVLRDLCTLTHGCVVSLYSHI